MNSAITDEELAQKLTDFSFAYSNRINKFLDDHWTFITDSFIHDLKGKEDIVEFLDERKIFAESLNQFKDLFSAEQILKFYISTRDIHSFLEFQTNRRDQAAIKDSPKLQSESLARQERLRVFTLSEQEKSSDVDDKHFLNGYLEILQTRRTNDHF